MADLTTSLKNSLFNHVLRNTSYTSPTTVYIAAFTTATTDGGGGTEVSGGSYARVAVTFGAPTDGAGDNSGLISFPTATASWGTITHAAIYDASSGGTMLIHGALSASKTIDTDDTLEFAIGEIDVTFA